jgi:hypothetical protein
MVLFARSDQLEIKCERGGSHVRPRRDPADPQSDFIPIWGVDCKPCEGGHLRQDPHWSKSRHRIPLTPDEHEEAQAALKEAAFVRGQLELARARTEAQQYREMIATGELAGLNAEDVVITGASEVVSGGPGGAPVTTETDWGASYRGLPVKDLRDLSRDRGLAVTGNKADLVARLAEYDQQAAGK